MHKVSYLQPSHLKIIKRTGLIIVAIISLLSISFLIFRNQALQSIISELTIKSAKQYNSRLVVKDAHFEGFSEIKLEHVSLVPLASDTLVSFKEIKVGFSFWNALIGRVQVNKLNLKNGYIQLLSDKNGSNYNHFLKNKPQLKSSEKQHNYAKQAYAKISKILRLIPVQMSLHHVKFKYQHFDQKFSFIANHLTLDDEELDSEIQVQTTSKKQLWKITGTADPRHEKANIKIYSPNNKAIQLPYLDGKYGLQIGFNTLHFNLDEIDKDSQELILKGSTSVTYLTLNHPKIASNEVLIPIAGIQYQFNLGADYIELDKSTEVQLNAIKLHPYIAYHTQKDTIYSLQLDIPTLPTQDFISSLPTHMFSHFQDLKATGNMSYHLNFKYNKNNPEAVVLDSRVDTNGFKITDFGTSELTKMNTDFIYRALDKGVLQRPISVSENNPRYIRLDQISPYLEKSVLTSEDPSFYNHNGFINEAFKQSIVKNIKTKKFARGASTISMQLVKNIFLTRDKNLSRKLEEIMLVYVLENQRITSKKRMLEIYFNIIEWGPNVYGIGEAASFYFQKHPAHLTLKESLFLASIIPRPKKYRWQFDNFGQLKPFAKTKGDFIKNLMLKRGLITYDDTLNYHVPLRLNGSAASFIVAPEIATETPENENFEEFE